MYKCIRNATSENEEREKPTWEKLSLKRGKYKHVGKHEGREASTRPPKDNFYNPKHGLQLKIVW